MARKNEIYLRKSTGSVKSSLASFGFAVLDIPWPPFKAKELATRDWPGEDGEDVYIPARIPAAAYDIEIEMVYKGSRETAYTKYCALRNYLSGADGSGAELMVYDPYKRIGRKGVFLKAMDDGEFMRSNVDEILSIPVTFRVSDPVTDITLTYVGG